MLLEGQLLAGLAALAGVQAAAPAPPAPRLEASAAAPSGGSPLGKLSDLLDADFSLGPWTFHGYFQFDVADYGQAPAGPADQDFRRGPVGEESRARQLSDGALLRRARLGGEGSIGGDLAYRLMLELAPNGQRGQPRIAEAWVSYSRFAPWVITGGAFPQPANLADATSFDSTLFLERPAAAYLSRSLGAGDGRLGITLKRTDPRWFAALSLTGPPIDHGPEFAPRAAVVARVSRALSAAPDRSLHLGASATYVLTPSGQRAADVPAGFPLRFRATPEVNVDGTALIDTGDLATSRARVFGLELAAQRGPLFWQGEAFRFQVERGGERLPDARFLGFYLEGSWILTGERRRFDPSRAAFWFPKPRRPLGEGWGAWELVFRYSRMNLNDRAGEPGLAPPPGGVRGGDQKILALGVNWYPRRRVRLMLDAMRAVVDRLNPAGPTDPEPFGPPPATPPVGVQVGQRMNIVALRVRYSF
jgi:phosphate-selective porin OprO/OprP